MISLSSHVSPEWSESCEERTSTTVTNAFVKPILRDYVGTLRRELRQRGVTAALDIMQSSGGVMPADAAVEKAAFCLDSGPAAGVMATCALGSYLGIKNAVTFEMGGTTTKSTIIEDGRAHRVNETEIGTPISVGGRTLAGAGYTLRIPIIDTAEVGAGGGSIAAIDTGGSLSVGPEGAGALPGPVCYGRGGTRVTLTDANLLLGYLNENHPLGGKLRLDRAAAAKLFEAQIARPLRLSVKEAAYAVRTVANATMARAIRAVSTERGRDVRKFVLFASGGGGPGHAAEVARLIGIRTVIVPPIPGLFSALGLLWSPLEYHVSQAAKVPLHASDARAQLLALFRALTQRARADAAGADRGKSGIGLSYMTDLHYLGQFHELTVPVAGDIASKGLVERLRAAFEKEHARTYGYHSPEELVEVTNVRAVARPKSGGHAHRASPDGLKTLMADLYKPRSTRETWRIYFGPDFGECDVPVLARQPETHRYFGSPRAPGIRYDRHRAPRFPGPARGHGKCGARAEALMDRTDLRGSVQTVLGPIAPETLGATLMHEHIFVDLVSPGAAAGMEPEREITWRRYSPSTTGASNTTASSAWTALWWRSPK